MTERIRAAAFLISFAASLALAIPASSQQPGYDLVIRNGRIVDGTGNPWFYCDVAVRGDRIVAVGKVEEAKASREIDAKGLVVAPGFIDMHSHSDFLLLDDGSAQSKIRQGVTTEILGEGDSAGPYQGKLPARAVTIGGETVRWTTLGGYFDAIERAGISTNVGSYVGLNNVWQCVMGKSFDRPTAEQMDEMKKLVDQAMKDGALGLSSQVMMPPGSLATTDDVVALAKVVAPYSGIYSTHIRNEGTGVNVQANVYPYTRGNNNLVSIIPPWAHEGGTSQLLARLKDREQREKMKRDISLGIDGWYNHYTAVGGDWSRMLISGNNNFKGLTMDRVMSLRTQGKQNADLLDEMFDFLIEEGGSVSTVYAHHTEEDMNLAIVQPWCSIGSDGSAYATEGKLRIGNPHPRNFGTFPRVLGVYVRERELLRLEDAVRKMTSLNAAKAGLRDRGLLRAGMYADITIFDPDRVIDRATYTDPFQYNEGIQYVIVNGQIVLDGDKHTGARPGRALRRGI
jgi:N-acyl-D-amino-acid deacylase